jgi:hypothetical protein
VTGQRENRKAIHRRLVGDYIKSGKRPKRLRIFPNKDHISNEFKKLCACSRLMFIWRLIAKCCDGTDLLTICIVGCTTYMASFPGLQFNNFNYSKWNLLNVSTTWRDGRMLYTHELDIDDIWENLVWLCSGLRSVLVPLHSVIACLYHRARSIDKLD